MLHVGQNVHGLVKIEGAPLAEVVSDAMVSACAYIGVVLEAAKQRQDAMLLREALSQSAEAVSFYDDKRGILFTNPAYHKIFPHYPPAEELIGFDHIELYRRDLAAGVIDDPVALADPEAYIADRERRAATLADMSQETQSIAGRTYLYTRTRSKLGATLSRRADITDIKASETALKQTEQRLRLIAFTDALTGLRNRAFVNEHLIESAPTNGAADFSVMLMDLDGFKSVNDTHGHGVGDGLLRQIATALTEALPEAMVLSRLGGDEFLVAVTQTPDNLVCVSVAERMIAAALGPHQVLNHKLSLGASVGIARMEPGLTVSDLIGRADLAMYRAKRSAQTNICVFCMDMQDQARERLQLVEDLRGAAGRGELEVWYQPQFALMDAGERLVGFEALVRWRHPIRGLLAPNIFVPLAEEHGLIGEIGLCVMRLACADTARWSSDLCIAVNVSPLQLRDATFALKVAAILMDCGLDPCRVDIEITETALLGDISSTKVALAQLRTLGVGIALDDFGTGYSSLSNLAAFPIDKLKIDRSFVSHVDEPQTREAIICKAMIQFAHSIGIPVVAEGVETPEQLVGLRAEGCQRVQGYLLGRPMPAEDAAALAQAHTHGGLAIVAFPGLSMAISG
ncbi:MAG: putative bifunctional diguanylate cyclase/phosphodiesterase [Bosea sp. (in: a-proteobacteria)]